MVAYSFKKRFAPPIQAGTKVHTIRGPRKRHAMPGEQLQLFTGMRTKYCTKIIPDPTCLWIAPILIEFHERTVSFINVSGRNVKNLDRFAHEDGFENADDMAAFWELSGPCTVFKGFLIGWAPSPHALVEGRQA